MNVNLSEIPCKTFFFNKLVAILQKNFVKRTKAFKDVLEKRLVRRFLKNVQDPEHFSKASVIF